MKTLTLEPLNLLGKPLELHLKEGAAFYFKVLSCGVDYIDGFDDVGMNLRININDIDFVIDLSL